MRHILRVDRAEAHTLTRFARVADGLVTSPSAEPLELPFDGT